MRVSVEKCMKLIFFVVVVSLVGQSIVHLIFRIDSTLPEIELFLNKDRVLAERVGLIHSIEQRKYVFVGATQDSEPYRKYVFLVNGEKSTAVVEVRVEAVTDESALERFRIVRIE